MEAEKQTNEDVSSGFIRKRTLQATLKTVSQQMYARNKELADTNRMLSLLRTIDALVLESHASLKLICQQITDAIAESADYSFVGLLTRSAASKAELALYGMSGKGQQGRLLGMNLSRPFHLATDDADWLFRDAGNTALSLSGYTPQKIANILGCPERDASDLLEKIPLQSVYVVRLVVRQRLVGLLVVGFLTPTTEISEADHNLLDRLGESIGVALDNKLLFEENQRVVLQLQRTNKKLKALDETKDDFISMASHQLRTPLTSVKGYLSMVLEEDAGKINATQQKMLAQAFTSSQRMVYLIADLLNVSRLRTGKFIIDATPTSLATMIEEELAQLVEAAKARDLELTFAKPKDFPDLMLDETKTRQVVMNFIDNAIYYTPSGGHIKVELISNDKVVELRVSDDGIGVPKAEQRHLFTKFYRAGNARKARPDGTGLGLYMAKKVVAAQGGSVVFDSKEGKGSTFGFSFARSKVAVRPVQVVPPSIAVAKSPAKSKA